MIEMKEIKDAIEVLTGNMPEKVEENCGTTWFKVDDTWYYISINECEDVELNEALKGDK